MNIHFENGFQEFHSTGTNECLDNGNRFDISREAIEERRSTIFAGFEESTTRS
jgi:hypothetical protein